MPIFQKKATNKKPTGGGGMRLILKKNISEGLKNKKPQKAHFYLKPKVHREGNQGIPVISSIKYYTSKTSTYVGYPFSQLIRKNFMDHLERKFACPFSLIYLRFIDDIFFIWTGSKSNVEKFLIELNIKCTSIKFEYEIMNFISEYRNIH